MQVVEEEVQMILIQVKVVQVELEVMEEVEQVVM
jgi:hypothetical protein